MGTGTFLDGRLRAFASDALGSPVVAVREVSRGHGDASVYRVVVADGRAAALKVHRSTEKHRREVRAYRAWGPALAPEMPRLLAVRDAAPLAILLAWRAGRVDAPLGDAAAPALHRRAGGWLARLHQRTPRDPDPMPLDEAYRRRAAAWTARAETVLPAATVRETRAVLASTIRLLAGRRRVACHRDMTPRNWLARAGRLEAVIDFEHARLDVAEADMARLALAVWPERPELRRAFLGGYHAAGGPADPQAAWAPGLLVLEALGTFVWAAEHGDGAFEADGRRALGWALAQAR